MFRVTKKAKRPRVVLSREDDNESEQEEVSTPLVKKTKKRRLILSFDFEETDQAKRSKKSRKGFGFGGTLTSPKVEHESLDLPVAPDDEAFIYDKGSIAKLKGEQKYRHMEKCDIEETNALPPRFLDEATKSNPLPSFVPLNYAGGETVILAGDEALDYEDDESSQSIRREQLKKKMQEDIPLQWEAKITSRAGINAPPKIAAAFETASIEELKEKVSLALVHLKNQHEDLQQAFNRRLVDVNQIKDELDRQESEVKAAGSALEYYQELRVDLSSWVGAIRDLKMKVTPLQLALRLVDKEFVDRWIGLEDDSVNVLRDAGLLECVLGRQPPITQEAATVVDEFGRDMKSQHVMAREKRTRQREKVRREREINGDETDALIAENEKDEILERRKALSEALKVAMNELDEQYASLINLITLFTKWSKLYRDEYKQCFAGMSLADLSSVLVQVDLCSTHHPLDWRGDSFSWINDLKVISEVDNNIEESPIYRMVDKVLIPVVEDILEEQAYSLISTRQTKSLSMFFSKISELLPRGNILIDKLSSRLVNYIQGSLQGMAIPIMKSGFPPSASDEILEAVRYATKGQLLRLQKIISNLMTFWAPILGDKLAEPVLEFSSSQFIFLLSSLERKESSVMTFINVWRSLQETDWLGRPEFMLQAAPIRAAATVYR